MPPSRREAHHRIVLGRLANFHRFMRQVRQAQHQLIPRRLALCRLLVQCGDAVAQLARFRLLRLGLGGFLLAHQCADFLRHVVALGFERFDLCKQLAALFVEFEQLVNVSFIPCPRVARRWRTKSGWSRINFMSSTAKL